VSQSAAGYATRFEDDPWGRLPWLTAASVLLTFLSLMGFLRVLEEPLTAVPVPPPLRVEIVEIPATIQPPASPPAPKVAPSRPPPPPRPEPARKTQEVPAPPSLIDAPRDLQLPAEPAPTPQAEAPGPQVARPSASMPATVPATPSPGAQSPGSALPGGGQMGARAIYKPLPEIPDALRRRNLEMVAVARFSVAADGSAQVALIEPTSEPDLNRALLDSLKRWRFFPAMQNGKPVASSVDIRIPVSVK
jgi:protein TonB